MKKFLVQTVSTYRISYVVEAEDEIEAEGRVIDGIVKGDLKEFSQKHLDEVLYDTRRIKKKAYIELFDKDNDYLKSWNEEQKLNFINRIDENDEEEPEW
jgi:hypothetical protein